MNFITNQICDVNKNILIAKSYNYLSELTTNSFKNP